MARSVCTPQLWLFFYLALFVLFSILQEADAAVSYDLSPIDNYCSRWFAASTIKDDTIFINGGIQKYNGTGTNNRPITGINDWIIQIPVNKSWKWSESSFVVTGKPKNFTNPGTGAAPQSLIRGTMFRGPANTSTVFTFGGTIYMGNRSFQGYKGPDSSTYPLWTYDYKATDVPWTQYDISQRWMPNHGAAAEAVDQNLGFYLNGRIDWGTSTKTAGWNHADTYIPVNGMLIIDLTDQTSVNISTSSLSANGASRIGAGMSYVDNVGNKGILVAIGGQVNLDIPANETQGKILDLSTVDVFDIDSYFKDPSSNGTWFSQTTTGDIPEPRIDFCLSIISAPDNSSYNIYLYGGHNPTTPKNTAYDDAFVLSIPSFTWTKVFSEGSSPRYGHDCHVAGNRQMITLGGNITNGQCDWEKKGIAVLDMTDINWGSVFTKDAKPYQVPLKVVKNIGGTQDGKATMTKPKNGWDKEGLGTVFSMTRRWDGPKSTVTSSNNNSNTNQTKKSNTGAIAGGVVGGVAGLALIGLLAFFLHRRYQKSKAPSELDNNEVELTSELDNEKKKYELDAINAHAAELPGPVAAELNAPRAFIEAPRETVTYAAELPGTNVVRGGRHGVPTVRTPGDEELPQNRGSAASSDDFDMSSPPEEPSGR